MHQGLVCNDFKTFQVESVGLFDYTRVIDALWVDVEVENAYAVDGVWIGTEGDRWEDNTLTMDVSSDKVIVNP